MTDSIPAAVIATLLGVLRDSWGILLDSGIYVIFGLAIAGLVNVFVSSQRIAEHLGGRSFKSVLLSSLFGVPLPLCSCGVVPTAVSLYKRGASKGATVSFLVSTPETGVDSIAVSWALLDPLMTVFRPLAAFFTAIITGSFENAFGSRREADRVEQNAECAVCGQEEGSAHHDHGFGARLIGGVKYAFVELLGDIAKWFLLGVLIAGAIAYFVPEDLITGRAGYGWPAMVLMALAGIPLYMCATSSTPIAAALIAKGVSPGAALVFLLTGPATNGASLVVVSKFLGSRATVVYLLSILVSSLVFGTLLNWIYIAAGLDATSIVGKGAQLIPGWLKMAGGVGLLLLIANVIYQERKEKGCCCDKGEEHCDARNIEG